MMTDRDKVSRLQGEAIFLGFMSKILLIQPKDDMLKKLIADKLFASVPFAGAQKDSVEGLKLLKAWADNYIKTGLDSVAGDYMKVLVGPSRPLAPPWETSYLNERDKRLFQVETLKVRNWYESFGLEVQNKYREPDDTITFELEFVGLLAERACVALEQGDSEEYQRLMDAKRRFLREHLLLWVFKWCEDVYVNAQSDYYKGLSKLLTGAMKELSTI